ncbi:cytochrome c oxidase assembly factor CtaG [Naumannella cuiyingiana]|uniref:Cytochrome c oxidase assembly factor CtaG n=1 Tax=Naumannella cuiyingiana TaxID=1347891 RepID=A0A7Z0D832_9ACTN|nr:cytochrome c oxidase assembly factor CtaG [Naumannella cuiyingiana]
MAAGRMIATASRPATVLLAGLVFMIVFAAVALHPDAMPAPAPDPLTVLGAGLFGVAAGAAAVLTVSRLLCAIGWRRPERGENAGPVRNELTPGARAAARAAIAPALAWAGFAALGVPFAMAGESDRPLGAVLARLGADLPITSAPLGWALTAALAALSGALLARVRTWAGAIALLCLALAACIPAAALAVPPGPGADLRTDAVGLAAPAAVLALAAAIAGQRRVAARAGTAAAAAAAAALLAPLTAPAGASPGQLLVLGYGIGPGPSGANFLLPGRPNFLLAGLAVLAVIAYLAGVRALRRRGDRWPVGRTLAWVVGWLLVITVAVTRIWQYGDISFRYHMLAHMVLNLIAPVLLVLGGPLTLALRALRPGRAGGAGSARDAIESIMTWRPLRVLAHPVVIWLIFVGSFYLLYFSGLFGLAMARPWSHQLITLHFLLTGYAFSAVVIGVDQPPRPLPHLARLAFVFAAMPFHSFFAVIVMDAETIIGAAYFAAVAPVPPLDPVAEQAAAGQIAWFIGEIPLLATVLILLVHWYRADRREARRRDKAIASGRDEAYEAIQQMYADLARHDRD